MHADTVQARVSIQRDLSSAYSSFATQRFYRGRSPWMCLGFPLTSGILRRGTWVTFPDPRQIQAVSPRDLDASTSTSLGTFILHDSRRGVLCLLLFLRCTRTMMSAAEQTVHYFSRGEDCSITGTPSTEISSIHISRLCVLSTESQDIPASTAWTQQILCPCLARIRRTERESSLKPPSTQPASIHQLHVKASILLRHWRQAPFASAWPAMTLLPIPRFLLGFLYCTSRSSPMSRFLALSSCSSDQAEDILATPVTAQLPPAF